MHHSYLICRSKENSGCCASQGDFQAELYLGLPGGKEREFFCKLLVGRTHHWFLVLFGCYRLFQEWGQGGGMKCLGMVVW